MGPRPSPVGIDADDPPPPVHGAPRTPMMDAASRIPLPRRPSTLKRPIFRPGAPQTLPYSHAVETSGRLLFISGQGPLGPDGALVEGAIAAQVRQTLDNLAAVAAAAGADLSRAVKVNAFLFDVQRDFAAFNEVYRTVFTGDRPARTTVQAVLPLPGMLVEIEAILALDD